MKLLFNCFRQEMIKIRKACLLRAINLSIYFVASRIILFACFITYIYMGNKLTADTVFVTMAFFNTMRTTVTRHVPQSIAATAELMVTCKRIQVYDSII